MARSCAGLIWVKPSSSPATGCRSASSLRFDGIASSKHTQPSPRSATVSGYGRIYAAVVASGRKARGARLADLLIAATACSLGLPLYTRNPADFRALRGLVDVIAV